MSPHLYSVTRTWPAQLAIFWIAAAWLATGLYIGPSRLGRDPAFQRAGVNFLFIALLLMVLISLLPIGLLQTVASVNHGMWYALSAEFMQLPHMETLRWLRVVGDTVFTIGTLARGWFVLTLTVRNKSAAKARTE